MTTLATVDWAAWSFPALIAAAVAYLVHLDRDPTTRFRLVQFISDADGTANSASLGYVVALLVGTWLSWYEAVQGRMTDWMLTGYLGAFVLGGAARAYIGSRERTATLHRAPVQTEQTTTTTTRVDAPPPPQEPS